MRAKKGFTLVECVVAMAIVMIISLCFYSLMTFANISFNRGTITNYGLNQIKNVVTIFDESDFVLNNQFNIDDFADKMRWNFGIIDTEKVNDFSYNFIYSTASSGQYSKNGGGVYKFSVCLSGNNVSLVAKIYYNDKITYEMQKPYFKVVDL